MADPIWREATGFETYRSLEQREAVRTLVSSKPGSTVLILLPTGSGKSLVGLLHALAVGTGAVSVVVVPTTSLALDQAGHLRERLVATDAPDAEIDFAYHGGLSPDAKGQMLSRIRSGGQRVVFTSPEAMFGALGEALKTAAANGRLSQFVLDEAHVVASWGAEFRPDFQALGGLQRELRDEASHYGHEFRTVLMTATATASDITTLAGLFGGDDRKLVAGGVVALRPEIEYVVAEAPDLDERLRRVADALRHLPRPIFVYATRREDVRELERLAEKMGLSRRVAVTGDSSSEVRRSAIDALRGAGRNPPTADVAFGTSAFGLGIDVDDVRCVIHACLPESVDRYYQEVGRSGRDGRSALGLMLWTQSDLGAAKSLNGVRLISASLARERLGAMLERSVEIDGVRWVDLSALRIGLFEESGENEKWNSRTLASLHRAGLIRLVGSRRSDDGGALIGFRPLRHDFASDGYWGAFDEMRAANRRATEASLEAVLDIARGGRVCDRLLALYSVHDPAHLTADLVAHYACGGCKECSPPRPPATPPLPISPAGSVGAARGPSESALPPETVGAQSGGGGWDRAYARLIVAAFEAGIRHIVGTQEVFEERYVARALRQLVNRFGLAGPLTTVVAPDSSRFEADFSRDPALLLIPPDDPRRDGFLLLEAMPQPRLAVLPASHPSRERRDMTVRQMHPGVKDASGLAAWLARA